MLSILNMYCRIY